MKRQDYYYRKAKGENYRSRAVYKLKYIDEKFYIFKKDMNVLDLGASPGSWSQYAKEKVINGKVISVDLNNIRVDEIIKIKGDIFEENTLKEIENEMAKSGIKKFDIIMSDMSPKISGIKEIDHMKSMDLAKRVFEISKKYLDEGGSLIIKIFKGQDLEEFKRNVEKFFDFCVFTTPPASRKGSRETYLVCKRFKNIQ
ncbi:MAG: RlmE family RNA methyltransferase [Thermoplasmata archaeon]